MVGIADPFMQPMHSAEGGEPDCPLADTDC